MLADEVMLFIALLIIGGMFINGLHITTRGETEIAPDGTKRDKNAMIFYPLLKFIKQENGYSTVQYTGERLEALYRQYTNSFQTTMASLICSENALGVWAYSDEYPKDADKNSPIVKEKMWAKMVKFRSQTASYFDRNDIVILKEWYDSEMGMVLFTVGERKPVYKFSKYIRKPILECIKCMASFWGTLLFWSSYPWIVGGVELIHIPIWIVYCFSLSWVNMWLYNKSK